MRYYHLLFCLVIASLLTAQEADCGSPYLIAEGDDSNLVLLESTHVDVDIVGPIANVTVRQVYHNGGSQPIEATYVFPASTRAAVHGMVMHIGDRSIKAKIKEKAAARQTYKAAKESGKRTSLLEQHESNVFQMSVANILPGEQIEIEMRYTEFLLPQDQQYSFVFPTVVGPRYTGERAAQWASHGYTAEGKAPTSTFDIAVHMSMPVPIHGVSSRAHAISVVRQSEKECQIALDHADTHGGNRDFILHFSLTEEQVLAGAMTSSFNGENYFLCQVEAPEVCTQDQIVPREYVFIVDVSGSMTGFPLSVSKELMRGLLHDLKPTDRFNILFFAGGSWMLSESSILATSANIDRALDAVDEQQGGGGTNMLEAIKQAMAHPKVDGASRSFVIVTDGYVSVDRLAMDYVRQHLGEANFFAFGIGSSVNRQLIEGLAHVGRAKPYIVTNKKAAPAIAHKLRKYIEYPVMTDITISADVELYDLALEHIPDLMAGRPIYFFGKYKGPKQPQFTVSGRQGGKDWQQRVASVKSTATSAVLPYLWARETIKNLDDYGQNYRDNSNKERLVELGLAYNLLTRHTSFVAVDDKVVTDGQPQQKAQPLPMPAGVSNSAVGFAMEVEDLTIGTVELEITVWDDKGQRARSLEHILEALLASNKDLLQHLPDGQLSMLMTRGQKDPLCKAFAKAVLDLGLAAKGSRRYVIKVKQ